MGCSLENIAMKRGNYRCVAYYSFVQDFVQETSFENDFIVIQALSLDILSLISNITVKKSQATKRKQKKEILK